MTKLQELTEKFLESEVTLDGEASINGFVPKQLMRDYLEGSYVIKLRDIILRREVDCKKSLGKLCDLTGQKDLESIWKLDDGTLDAHLNRILKDESHKLEGDVTAELKKLKKIHAEHYKATMDSNELKDELLPMLKAWESGKTPTPDEVFTLNSITGGGDSDAPTDFNLSNYNDIINSTPESTTILPALKEILAEAKMEYANSLHPREGEGRRV